MHFSFYEHLKSNLYCLKDGHISYIQSLIFIIRLNFERMLMKMTTLQSGWNNFVLASELRRIALHIVTEPIEG